MKRLDKEKLLKYGVLIVSVNLWIIPLAIWIIWDFNFALDYFWKFSLGIPYMILTFGSFWYYNATKKGNLQIQSLNNRVEQARKLASKGRIDLLNHEESRRDKKIDEINKSIEIKEACDRLCYLLRIGAIVLAMYFFIKPGDSVDSKISTAIDKQKIEINWIQDNFELEIIELKRIIESQKLELKNLRTEQEKLNSPKNSKY